jgi:ankyrin repeat protein
MYLGRKATRLNDKVYALLGMSTDDPSHIAGLLANYGVSWKELLQRLVKYLLGDKIQVETWSNTRELAVIKGKGYVFGIVAQVQTENGENIRQSVKAIFRSGGRSEGELVCWTTQASAKSIQDGDIICFLEGASNPSIIRPCYDYFDIIIIAAKIPGNMVVRDKHSIARDFLLSWDWENLGKIQCQKRYKDLLPKNERLLENSANLQSMLDKATRIWDIALILEEVQEYEKAEEMRAEAIERYEGAFGVESNAMDSQTQYGLTPLSWAARNGHDAVVRELLTKRIPKIDPDLRDNPYGRTPLSRAAEGGYEAVVELLIETGEVDFDSKDTVFRSTQPRWATEERVFGMTPLLWAAGNGHKGVVQLLLETGKVDVNARDRQFGETPLLWAIKNGHEAVVALLLKTGKVNANAKDIRFGRTPLWWAIENGHEALVALLLKTGKVDVNARDPRFGGTPLLWAVQNGQEAVVTLLLKTGKANVDEKGNEGLSPLSRAVQNGDEVIVKLLLDIGKADVNVGSNNLDLTPLQSAAAAGHEVIVKLLLQAGNIKVDAEDQLLRTPLWWAACNGYEKVVKLLLDIGKAEVNTKDRFGVSPIWGAVDRGYMAVVKLLLDTGKANFDRKDWNYRQTTLQRAVETGHGAVIKQLKSAVENSQ